MEDSPSHKLQPNHKWNFCFNRFGGQNVNSSSKACTYNGLPALLYSSLVVRVAEVLGVQERLPNVPVANGLGLPVAQLVRVRLRLTVAAFLLFI